MGVQINGDTGNISATKADYSGNVTIGGTLTYEDVTNIDSVGLVTARSGIEIGARPGVAASISVDGNAIFSGITTVGGDVKVGSGVTLSPDGNIFATGISTFGGAVDASQGVIIDDSITHRNDTNTKIRFPADDTITAETGGSERARIESAGNVNVSQNLNVAGVCTATSFSGSGAALTGISAISNAQQFRLAADQAGSSSAGTVLTNWEEVDTDYQAIGSNWSQSSGVFSCSATGIYVCFWSLVVYNTNTGDAYDPNIQISTNSGSNYTTRSRAWAQVSTGTVDRAHVQNQFLFDVSNTSTFRLRYRQSEDNDLASGTGIGGGSAETQTNIMFIRLGNT